MNRNYKNRIVDEQRNLTSFLAYLPELEEALIKENSLGVLYVDGTQLAAIEEKFGSSFFDSVMTKVARALTSMQGVVIRKNDIVSLTDVQGYSYLIFLFEPREENPGHVLYKEDVEMVCERVQSYLYQTLFLDLYNYLNRLPKINVGYSLAVYNPMIHPRRTIYNLIDESKTIAVLQNSQNELKNRGRFQKIILEEKVTSLYQPIVDIKQKNIFGYEALSRGPKNSEIESPVILFTLAEEIGLLFDLDRLCRKKAIINAKGKEPGKKLFVNTFPNLIFDPEFNAKAFIKFLEKNGIPIDDVVFEITERNAIEHFNHFRKAITHYTNEGIRIAIDDVGAGYSSLEAIMELKPEFVKIDASIIRGIHQSTAKREMLHALHVLSKSIGAKTIAEGIETKSDFEVIEQLGVDYAQGYYFAKPGLPFPEIIDW